MSVKIFTMYTTQCPKSRFTFCWMEHEYDTLCICENKFSSRSTYKMNEVDVKKTLAIAEVPVLSIQEGIKDNGGQMAVYSQKLEPNGNLSFQVFAMNNDDDHGDNTEETDHSVMVKVIFKD